ncbi:peptidase M50B family protein, partial [Xanthomonas citri pv. citri]|nr:peptidase M50B family protein [Xanthomonas citri pv. citri]
VHTRALPTALVSLVGPLSNVAVALLGEVAMSFAPATAAGPGWALLQLLVLANWVLGLFNLLPGLPLDGGRVVESLVWAVTGSETRGT